MSHPLQLALRPRRTTLDVLLHEPAHPEDECPILQDQIATAKLDNFPHPFLAGCPALTAMTLPCKHTFHAMALVYHWARSGTVQCPVCRAGPSKGQCLALNRLPREWKYSLAARIRRERKRDHAEEERVNHQMALQHSMVVVPAFELGIRIEAQIGVSPATWTLKTNLIELRNLIVFDVPVEELRRIPQYPPGTLMRLTPFTRMHLLRPSNWFRPGTSPGGDFSVACNETGFLHMNLTMREDGFATLVSDLIMGRFFNGADGFQLVHGLEGFQLVMLSEDP